MIPHSIPVKSIASTLLFLFLISSRCYSQPDPYKADAGTPAEIPGMFLVWNDEFTTDGKPDEANWRYESGFVRNQELQWYQQQNAYCKSGLLIIEGRKQRIKNPLYEPNSSSWARNREYAEYTSASLKTQGLQQWQYGRLEVRARIDTSVGSWPAIWTLGVNWQWPQNGEVDIMEYYRIGDKATILANTAWGRNENGGAIWNSQRYPLAAFLAKDADWNKKFHTWRMDWNKDSINIYLDNELLNTTLLSKTLNPDGGNPFQQPHYLLLNLALGANGGDPSGSSFPIKYEVDFVRCYKKL